MAAKSSSLSHVSFFGVDDENKVDQSLIFFFLPAFFAGQNDQLRLKSSKTVLKAFQLIFSVAEDEVEDVVYLES